MSHVAGHIGTTTAAAANALTAKNKTASAGGPAAAGTGVTPAPLGDISKLPTDTNSV
ncbi:MAG: hypothetical protein FJZ00_09270, partial [Candidatus Sericytochromatia bacterium]|nr:hypothetical protein [Candidatus Tanganyikabacteria bacterium]